MKTIINKENCKKFDDMFNDLVKKHIYNVQPTKEIIHFRPYWNSRNVHCLNGSAHVNATSNIKEVTCLKCLNPNTAKDFWHRFEQKHGNENRVFK